MKTPLQRRTQVIALMVLLGSTLGLFPVAGGETNELPASIVQELQRMREEIEEQGQRLERLYRALGPHLKELEAQAAEQKKQEMEDQLLAMERVADLTDQVLRPEGCGNPAAGEFAVLTRSGGVRIFDEQGRCTKTIRESGQMITAIAFSPSGGQLLAGTQSGALLLHGLSDGTSSVLSTNVGQKVDRVAWLGPERVAWGSGSVNFWEGRKPANRDKHSGGVLARADGKKLWTFQGFIRQDFYTLGGSIDGRHLVVLEIPDQPRGAFLLNSDSGAVVKTFCDQQEGHSPLSAALSPNGRVIAMGCAPYDIILWDVDSGEELKWLKGHKNWVVSLAFSRDSTRLVSGAGDSTARVWDVPRGKEIGRLRFEGRSTYVESVGLSPKGDRVFVLTANGQFIVAKVPSSPADTRSQL